MNALDRDLDGPALLHYGDGEFAVIKPGRYVVCAVSARRIPLEALRYWSSAHQEAYAGAQESLARLRETGQI
jgi:hypothetical protein